MCSLIVSQIQNIFHDGNTHLTVMSLLDWWIWLWSPDLWHSFQRNTLSKRCLLILYATQTTWKQRNASEVHVVFRDRWQSHHKYVSDIPKNEYICGCFQDEGVGVRMRKGLPCSTGILKGHRRKASEGERHNDGMQHREEWGQSFQLTPPRITFSRALAAATCECHSEVFVQEQKNLIVNE